MNLSEQVRSLSRTLNVSLSEIARRTGQSPANLSKKLSRETLSFEDFEKILNALGVRAEYRFTLPDGSAAEGSGGGRAEQRIAILEKALEVERLKNEYFRANGFTYRTAMETILGCIELLGNHSEEPARVRGCAERMRGAAEQIARLMEEDPLAEKTPSPKAPLGGRRVLVADDNAINRGVVIDLLADSGLEADEAADGAEAAAKVAAAPAGRYGLVLMDLKMPGTDGFEAARAIRSMEGGRADTPIIAMTASVSEEDRRRAGEAGMNGFVAKPLNMKKLLGLLT